jgi:hypothetical protein
MWSTMSTDVLPAGERVGWFHDVVARDLAPADITPEVVAGFRARAAALSLGRVGVSRFSYTGVRARRTPALIRRGDPKQHHLAPVTDSSMWMSQRRNDSGLVAGDMVLWDTSYPYEAGSGTPGGVVDAVVVRVPMDVLPLPAGKVDKLLARHLRVLGAHSAECTPRELEQLGDAASTLVSAFIARHAEVGLPVETRAQALLARVSAFIDHHLGDPDLTPGAITALAARQVHNGRRTVRTSRQVARSRVGVARPRGAPRARSSSSAGARRDPSRRPARRGGRSA